MLKVMDVMVMVKAKDEVGLVVKLHYGYLKGVRI
jgi:hypothetical protein